MSGFGFSEEHEMFRRMVREFARKELAPAAKERAKQSSFPREIVRRMGEVGLLAITHPAKYGGQEADLTSLGIAVEEIAKVDFCASLFVSQSHLASKELALSTEDMQQEWLPLLRRGELLSCTATTEPEVGSDAAAMKMRATKRGDSYFLSGEKTSITLGMLADAAIIWAKTDPTAGARGVTCFWVPLNLPGIDRYAISDTGWIPLSKGSIIMDEVEIPARYRLGEEGQGFYIAMETFDDIRVLLGLMGLGVAQSSLEDAISYAKERQAFGKPIGKFEGVSFKIAEAATSIEAAKWLCYRTLWLGEQGIPHSKESAMCKWFCPKVAVHAIHDCLLIHGHMGYSAELPLEQRLRDVIGLEIGDGTAQIMKLVIVRELMGRECLPY